VKIIAIEYSNPARFVLDGVRFSYPGNSHERQSFMEWNPTTGFRIDFLLDKTFAPLDAVKTLGRIIVNTRKTLSQSGSISVGMDWECRLWIGQAWTQQQTVPLLLSPIHPM
jgi:hypothetical protein